MRLILVFGVALAVISMSAAAWGAADWQWTKNQGWSVGGGTARPNAEEQLRYAYSLEQKGELLDAARQYFLLLKVYPDAPQAGVALQRLAKCLFEMENYYQAFQAIEQVLISYPQSGRLADFLAIQMKIARKLQEGARPSILKNDDDPLAAGRKAACEVYEAVLKHDPYGPLADDALLALGEVRLEMNEPKIAREHFARLLNEFSKSPLVDKARLGLTRCDVLEGKASSSDVQRTVKEIRAKEAAAGKPAEDAGEMEKSVSELENLEAKKMWDGAMFYLKRGTAESVSSAIWTLKELIRRYPRTECAAQARELLPQIQIPKKGSAPIDLSRLNILPFKRKKEEGFVVPQLGEAGVKTEPVSEAVPGIEPPGGESIAVAKPASPSAEGERQAADSPLAPASATVQRPAAAPSPDVPKPESSAVAMPAGKGEGDAVVVEKTPSPPPPPPPHLPSGAPPQSKGEWVVDLHDAPPLKTSAPRPHPQPPAPLPPGPGPESPSAPPELTPFAAEPDKVPTETSEAHAVPAAKRRKSKPLRPAE